MAPAAGHRIDESQCKPWTIYTLRLTWESSAAILMQDTTIGTSDSLLVITNPTGGVSGEVGGTKIDDYELGREVPRVGVSIVRPCPASFGLVCTFLPLGRFRPAGSGSKEQRTERCQLGFGILCTPYRNPFAV